MDASLYTHIMCVSNEYYSHLYTSDVLPSSTHISQSIELKSILNCIFFFLIQKTTSDTSINQRLIVEHPSAVHQIKTLKVFFFSLPVHLNVTFNVVF